MKKIVKNINIIIITFIIMLTTFVIGSPLHEENAQIVYIIVGIYSVIYFTVKLLKREKIINNKIDVCICILAFSTIIPLIFKTYVSLTETVHVILKYFCVLSLYLIIKNECSKEPKNITLILNTIIFSICILCIIGLDEVSKNYLEKFKKLINFKIVEYDEKRISSLFAYPNTMAAIAAVGIFLSVGGLFKTNRLNVKILYIITSILMLVTMILTYSRLVYILFGIIIIFYGIVLGKKYGINRFINKKTLLCISTILVFAVVYVLVGLQISDNLKIKDNYQKILYTVNSNQDYNFKFKIESNAKIKITEKNKYFDDIKVTEKETVKGNDIIEIPIKTTISTSVIYINIENLKTDKTSLNVKEAYLNDNKFILKYKFLPTEIVDKIKSINLNNKSVWERLTFIQDALSAVKDNWMFGLGGNAWRTIQLKVQSYNYYAKEVHCYPVQVFLENGIVGFIACFAIGTLLIINLVTKLKEKELDLQEISIFFAVVFLILHSLLDFDLSFFYVLIIVATMIAIISSKKKKQGNLRLNNLICIILIIMSAINIEVAIVENYYATHSNVIVVNKERTRQKIFENYYKLLPFNSKVKRKTFTAIRSGENRDYEKMKALLKNLIETEKYSYSNIELKNLQDYVDVIIGNNDIKDQDIDYIIAYLKSTRNFARYQTKLSIARWTNLNGIAKKLKQKGYNDYSRSIQEELNREINENEKYILDYEKARYKKEEVEKYKEEIDKIKE